MWTCLSGWFVGPDIPGPHKFKELLRGLDHISITNPALRGDDWSPLTNFLSRRAAVGNSISSLALRDHPQMDEDAVESIKCVVKVVDLGNR